MTVYHFFHQIFLQVRKISCFCDFFGYCLSTQKSSNRQIPFFFRLKTRLVGMTQHVLRNGVYISVVFNFFGALYQLRDEENIVAAKSSCDRFYTSNIITPVMSMLVGICRPPRPLHTLSPRMPLDHDYVVIIQG